MKLLRSVKKMVCGVVVAAMCSSCAVGAGGSAVSLYSAYTSNLTTGCEKDIIEKACKEMEYRQLNKQEQE